MLDERTITVTAFARAPSKVRVRRAVLCVATLLVLLLVGTGAAYQAFLNHTPKINIKHSALLPAPSVDHKQVSLVHFPRDLYVDVPGHHKDTISSAFGYGGPQLLVRTLQQLVDVPIDHVGFVKLDGLAGMTDALDGVDVNVAKASSGRGLTTLRKGVNTSTVRPHSGFIRARSQPGENDVTRGRRQLTFIKALMVRALSKDALSNRITFAEFRDAATTNLTVDNAFAGEDMRSLASALKGLGSNDIVPITAPIAGLGKSATGTPVHVVNVSRMALLSTALRTDSMAGFPIT